MENADAIAIAGGALALSLIDTLVLKKIITAEDRQSILDDAQRRLVPYGIDQAAGNAARILTSMRGFSAGA